MAPKRPPPIEQPPAVSLSEEEVSEEELDSEKSEFESEEEQVPDPKKKQNQKASRTTSVPNSAINKKNSSKKPEVQTQSSSADEDSGSEDSESDDQPESIVNANVKPLSSKATASASVAMSPAKSTGKRPVESSEDAKVSKRAKKKGVEASEDLAQVVKKSAREDAKKKGVEASEDLAQVVKKSAREDAKKKGVEASEDSAQVEKKSVREDAKKAMFQRIWSNDDEIVILNGIINYSTEKGKDPSSDVNAFHEFIKKSLHIDFSKSQLMDKVRRLKKKYVNNAKRSKKGADPTFSKSHEQKSYELSKKVWGTEATNNGVRVEQTKSNVKAKKAQKSDRISTPIEKGKLPESPQIPEDPQPNHETKHTEEEILIPTEIKNDSILLNQSIAAAGLDLNFMKEGLGLIDHGERLALEEKWRELQLTQMALYLRRINLVGELITLALETPKKQ